LTGNAKDNQRKMEGTFATAAVGLLVGALLGMAAGVAFGATLIALAILISGQIRRDDSLVALAVWIPISLLVLLGSRWLVDLIILPDARIHEEIARDRNWGVALIEGSAAIGIALLLDATFS
jgi:uncharacterized membrane protein YjfL (UPF0719 family)